MGKKCIQLVALGLSMDSESKNRGAQDLFEELNASGEIDNCLTLSDCIPDAVHLGKRILRQFSNWFLIVQGCRINKIQLRTLRNDPNINGELKKHLTVAACRNRDRMDVESMLEISDYTVRNIVSTGAPYITETLIPEKYKLYEGNKKGVVSSPSGICLASPGTFLFTDSREGKLHSAQLHYPVDVVESSSSLCTLVGVAFKDGVVYIADNGNIRIAYCDLSGKIVYDLARLTVKELKKVLEDLKLIPANTTNLHKADLKQLLQNWIDQQQPEPGVENDLSETGQRKQLKTVVSGKMRSLKCNMTLKNPSALHIWPCTFGK